MTRFGFLLTALAAGGLVGNLVRARSIAAGSQ
jgi:hypothetical protein